MSPSLTKILPAALLLGGSLGLGGCATKGYVNDQIATVNQRIDSLDAKVTSSTGQALAEAQAASGQSANNAQRIDQLNGRVDGLEQRVAQRKRARN